MTLFLFAAALGWSEKEVLPNLRALSLTEPCARCAGTGYYDRLEQIQCFKCVGKADQLPRLTLELSRSVAARVVRGELRAHFARRRQERARA